MIAADRLVPVGRLVRGFVERIAARKIEHTEVGILVLQNELIGRRFGEVALHRFGFFETIGVQVAAIDVPQVAEREQEEHTHHGGRRNGFRPLGISRHQRKGDEREEEGAPSGGRKNGGMERKEGTLVAIDEIGGHAELLQLSKSLLVGRRKQIGRIGHERIEQTHAHREDGGHTEGDFAAARAENLFGMANHFGQGEHRQDGHGELCDHQGRRNGAEFGVHGQHVDEEVGGCHEVMSPGEEEREQGGCGERPLERAAHQTEAEHEEEADDGTHIDGTYGERLVTPILDDARHVARAGGLLQLRGVLIELVVAFQLFYAFAVENAARSAAFEVGHQERERLVDPVAPLRDVVARQSVSALCRGSIGGFGLFG